MENFLKRTRHPARQIVLMGGETKLASQRAMHAFARRDSEVANQVIENDRVIDLL